MNLLEKIKQALAKSASNGNASEDVIKLQNEVEQYKAQIKEIESLFEATKEDNAKLENDIKEVKKDKSEIVNTLLNSSLNIEGEIRNAKLLNEESMRSQVSKLKTVEERKEFFLKHGFDI